MEALERESLVSSFAVASARRPRYARNMDVERTETRKRSIVKAVTYRVFIVCLDFAAVYLLTGKAQLAAGFMIVSNVYTTVGYFAHERVWSRIRWGLAR